MLYNSDYTGIYKKKRNVVVILYLNYICKIFHIQDSTFKIYIRHLARSARLLPHTRHSRSQAHRRYRHYSVTHRCLYNRWYTPYNIPQNYRWRRRSLRPHHDLQVRSYALRSHHCQIHQDRWHSTISDENYIFVFERFMKSALTTCPVCILISICRRISMTRKAVVTSTGMVKRLFQAKSVRKRNTLPNVESIVILVS